MHGNIYCIYIIFILCLIQREMLEHVKKKKNTFESLINTSLPFIQTFVGALSHAAEKSKFSYSSCFNSSYQNYLSLQDADGHTAGTVKRPRVSELEPIHITAPQGQLHTSGGCPEGKRGNDKL